MAQFRVEFVLDEASGLYLAELYHPQRENEVIVRTEALYPTQEAALLGVVQLFKDAILQFPRPPEPARRRLTEAKRRKAKKAAKKKPSKKKKPARKATKRRK